MQCVHFSVEMAFKYILVYYKCWSLHLTKHFNQQKSTKIIMNLNMKSYITGSKQFFLFNNKNFLKNMIKCASFSQRSLLLSKNNCLFQIISTWLCLNTDHDAELLLTNILIVLAVSF